MQVDVLAIMAHPDDAELSCAGILLMEKRQGKRIGIVDLTRGELGTRGNANIRQQEAANAEAILGLDVRANLAIPDGFFTNTQLYQLEVIRAIRTYRPTIIITNAPEDRHPDHGRAAALVRDAAWLSGLRKIETLTEGGQLAEPWRPKQVFHCIQDRYLPPSFVYDISPVMDQKIAAIRAYATQFDTQPDEEPQTYISTPAFLESIIERAKMLGKMVGVQFAEGLITQKVPGITSFNSLIHQGT